MHLTATRILACLALLASALPSNGHAEAPAEDSSRLDDLRTLSDMVQLIRDNYVDEIGEDDLLHSAMAGLVAGLDEHSGWLPASRFQAHNDSSRGRQGGIGATFEVNEKRLFVDAIAPDSPAEIAGLEPGDQLLAVDGEPVRGRRLDTSLQALDGEPGTTVTLRIRDRSGAKRTIDIERAYVPVDSVSGQWLEPGTAYLAISHFNDHTDRDFEHELEQLGQQPGAIEASRIIIDLRDNRGGVLTSALAVADGFLESGLVVETRGRTPSTRMSYVAQPGQWRPQARVAVLTSSLTASSAEILAGSLQDHGRAIVLGRTSFGKGTVQSVVRLHNGSALKFTTARYYTPSGREIDQSGIKPNIEIRGGLHPTGDVNDPVIGAAMSALKTDPPEPESAALATGA
ncbi:S41 family peptidase [Marinihelvus fidelis]|uniref:S41 family peptidase n=1 Tax=Marinihelvus fidelis TaxID=2613842 RepID=A0A5N0TA86_9GAMM|nr:S41 family peptidase [Marinihelvus fidelis]KAA9131850.1 S41 family peptidase [Marinihelvus fidelis]